MAYQIRYGFDRYRCISPWGTIRHQAAAAAGLLVLSGLLLLTEGGTAWLIQTFSGQAQSAGERAVLALSRVLAEGEGWYRALTVWCREIIDAGAV